MSIVYDYGDLLAAPVPLDFFAELCGVSLSAVKNWGRVGRSIPKSHAGVISQYFEKLFNKNKDLRNDTSENIDFINKNNGLNDLTNLTAALDSAGIPFFINDLEDIGGIAAPLGNTVSTQAQASDSTARFLADFEKPHIKTEKSFADFLDDILPIKKIQKAKKQISNPASLRLKFLNIKRFQPLRFFSNEVDSMIKITGSSNLESLAFFKDKKLHSSSKNSCQFVDSSGEFFKFQRRFIENKSGKWIPTNEWLHVPSQSFLTTEKYALHDMARELLPDYGIFNCLHAVNRQSGLLYNQVTKSARFIGLQTCSSVWHCPICAAKISSSRAAEVQAAYAKHKERGGQFSFVTRTVPHTDCDSLEFMRDTFRLAEHKLKGSSRYKKLLRSFGVIGSIKVYEITVTTNGWHLHCHEIYFHESIEAVRAAGGSDWLAEFEELMFPIWHDSAVRAGFEPPSREYGLVVKNGDFAAEYIAKYGKDPLDNFWNIDREMTKQHLKRSRGGLSPFDLLKQYRATGQRFYGELFQEYAKVMQGSRQLMWSRGLKDYFLINEKTDSELMEENEGDSFVLGYFRNHWKAICDRKLKAKLINLAAFGDFNKVCDFLRSQGLDFYPPADFEIDVVFEVTDDG